LKTVLSELDNSMTTAARCPTATTPALRAPSAAVARPAATPSTPNRQGHRSVVDRLL